jgi:hypothetical protein
MNVMKRYIRKNPKFRMAKQEISYAMREKYLSFRRTMVHRKVGISAATMQMKSFY